MSLRKLSVVALAAAVLNYVLPQPAAWADGSRGTAAEERDYAGREAQSPAQGEFVGGSAVGIVIGILVIVALVVLIWYLLEHHHGHASAPRDPDTRTALSR